MSRPDLPLSELPPLDDEERTMMRLASSPVLVPMERIELLHLLGYPDTLPPHGPERVLAAVERVLHNRGLSLNLTERR